MSCIFDTRSYGATSLLRSANTFFHLSRELAVGDTEFIHCLVVGVYKCYKLVVAFDYEALIQAAYY